MAQQRATWDFGRFVKTLSYFGSVPLLSNFSWFQEMLGSPLHPTSHPSTIAYAQSKPEHSAGTILLLGAAGESGARLAQALLEKGSVRTLLSDVANPNVEAVAGDFAQPETALPQLMADVSTVAIANPFLPGLDSFIDRIAPLLPRTTAPDRTIFDFRQSASSLQDTWGAIDDVVMGGVSTSGIQLGGTAAVFSGTVSTANSGGFASVRTRNFNPPIDLSGYEGVSLRVRGDGQRYKFLLRDSDRWDGMAYSYSFDTVADIWTTVRIPFTDLIPVFRAKTVKDAEPFNPSRIAAFQLMLSKFEYDGQLNPAFQPGEFQLHIEAIAAYGEQLPQIICVGPIPVAVEASLKRQGTTYVSVTADEVAQSW
jgi:uncharacterized protein YbjT (DUF2867 family)